ASAYDIPVIPHGHSVPATVNLIAAQPEPVCPIVEYLVKWNTIHQYFLKHPIVPADGKISLPTEPGLGMTLDEDKIQALEELCF
ncbi:MAG: mandelate racemase/muconate lactonizing protein, partial [Anaerolineae bacterium]|nr:mandelate racemase/muconate lactonizing protein [Anaerolineae bacterium]